METATSADGTTIAYERTGSGPALILVAGALTGRAEMRPLAEALSGAATVVNYDRRSRGDSGDAQTAVPETAEREIEDVAALAAAVGGSVSVYGHSSGAALALRVAAALDPERLILHEPPFDPEEPDAPRPDSAEPPEYGRRLRELLERGDEAGAVELFLSTVGMPAEMIAAIKASPEWPAWVAKGRSLAYDSAAVGDAGGGRVPWDLLPEVACPTLVMAGSETFPFMLEVAETLARGLPRADRLVIPGADHESGPDLIAPPVRAFLAG